MPIWNIVLQSGVVSQVTVFITLLFLFYPRFKETFSSSTKTEVLVAEVEIEYRRNIMNVWLGKNGAFLSRASQSGVQCVYWGLLGSCAVMWWTLLKPFRLLTPLVIPMFPLHWTTLEADRPPYSIPTYSFLAHCLKQFIWNFLQKQLLVLEIVFVSTFHQSKEDMVTSLSFCFCLASSDLLSHNKINSRFLLRS